MLGNRTPGKPRRAYDPSMTSIGGSTSQADGFNRHNIKSLLFFNKGAGYGEDVSENDILPDTVAEVGEDMTKNLPEKDKILEITKYSIPASIPQDNSLYGIDTEDNYHERKGCCKRCCCGLCGKFKSICESIKNWFSNLSDSWKNMNLFGSIFEKLGNIFTIVKDFIASYWLWILLALCIIPLLFFISKFENTNRDIQRDIEKVVTTKHIEADEKLFTGCVKLCEDQKEKLVDEIVERLTKKIDGIINESMKSISVEVPEVKCDKQKAEDKNKIEIDYKNINDNLGKTLNEYLKGIEDKINSIKKETNNSTDLEHINSTIEDSLKKIFDENEEIQKIVKEHKDAFKKYVDEEVHNFKEYIKRMEKNMNKKCETKNSDVKNERVTFPDEIGDRDIIGSDDLYKGIIENGVLRQNLLTKEMGCNSVYINRRDVRGNRWDRINLFNISRVEGELTKIDPMVTIDMKKVVMIEAKLGCGSYCDKDNDSYEFNNIRNWKGLKPTVFEIAYTNYRGNIKDALIQSPTTFRVYDTEGLGSGLNEEPTDRKPLFEGKYDIEGDERQFFKINEDIELKNGVKGILIVFDVLENQKKLQLFRLGMYGDSFEEVESK